MKKLTVCVLVLIAALMLAMGCKKSPQDQIMGHMEKIVSLIEANKADPAKAAEALDGYMKQNKSAIEGLAAEMKKSMEGLSPEEAMKKMAGMMEQMAPLQERIKKLQADNPELFANPAVAGALGGIGQLMGPM